MSVLKISDLYSLEHTIAAEIFEGKTYPWEILGELKSFIVKLGQSLDPEKFIKRGEDIWIAKSATVFDSAYIAGPCIIDEGAEVRHCAFIRGSAIIGKNAVVGDSVLGYKSHMGAGSITSNVKSDKTLVVVKSTDEKIETGLKKFGAMLGDFVEVGCGSVLNPGTVIGKNSNIYPLSSVRGVVPADSIYKASGNIVTKR